MKKIINLFRLKNQQKRFDIFYRYFGNKRGKLLDLGGGDGSFLARFKDKLVSFDLYVADIDDVVLKTAETIGFSTIKIGEAPPYPFADGEYDVVFYNSVIEHCTGPKQEVLKLNQKKFKDISIRFQKQFAFEINRISKSYFVQTPHKYFPVESHTQFPFIGYINRALQVRAIKILNSFWIKRTKPDWNLLDENDMRSFFPEGEIFIEYFLGYPKSIIVIKV